MTFCDTPAMVKTLDEARVTAWRLFLSAHTTVIERIERELAAAGLPSLRWYDVLYALEGSPGRRLRMHELSRRIVLSRSNLTRLVDRMQAAGLLGREADATDRRGAFAVLQAEGTRLRRRMWPVYARGIADYFADHLSQAEAEALAEVFERLLDAADGKRAGQAASGRRRPSTMA